MKGFRWMCFGLAVHFLLLGIWMLLAFSDLTKLYAIAPIPASPFFFWAFHVMGIRIKQEAAQEARTAEKNRLEEQCLVAYQTHRQKSKEAPRDFN